MSDHVQELLDLRDGSTDGELLYRKQVLRLLGAEDEELGFDRTYQVNRVRRVEGVIAIPDGDGVLTGLVVFAIGDDGRGALADVRSKSGQVSARSLLVARDVDFVVLVTTGEPSAAMVEAAEVKSDLFWLGGVLRRRIWVMGVPEVVRRGELLLAGLDAVPAVPVRRGWRRWFSRAVEPLEVDVPASPLLLRLEEREVPEVNELEVPAE